MNESLARLQILVVDDSEYMRGVMRTVLRAIGVTKVHEAENGSAAV